MAIAVTNTKNSLCTAYANAGGTANQMYVSIHQSDPGSSGTSGNEPVAGTNGYARMLTTWGSPSAGQISGTQVTISAPAGTWTFAGLWSAASGGTFIDKVAIASTTLGSAGTLLITPTFTVT